MTGDALRGWRESRELSRPALAELLDVHPRTLENYERGTRPRHRLEGSIPKLFRLALAAIRCRDLRLRWEARQQGGEGREMSLPHTPIFTPKPRSPGA